MMKLDINQLKILENSNDFIALKQILLEVKNNYFNYFDGVDFDPLYIRYIRNLNHYRNRMKDEYITDVYVDNIANFDKANILYCIVSSTREFMSETSGVGDINKVDLTNYCNEASLFVSNYCKSNNIKCRRFVIYPGYNKEKHLNFYEGYHFFNVIEINDKQYLIDTTYKQFFKKNSFFDEIGIPYMCAPTAGHFMMIDDEQAKLAISLLKNGFIELTDNNLKLYLDGFTMSYRNGLYYMKNCNVDYSPNKYKEFLNGADSQLNYESIDCLGYQKKLM